MKYAVIRISGKQYKVSEGEEILVDKLEGNPEPEVLLVVDDGKAKIGKPVLKEAKVQLKVLNKEEKGTKLYVTKFRAKSRYRKKIGFRPHFTRLIVEKIT